MNVTRTAMRKTAIQTKARALTPIIMHPVDLPEVEAAVPTAVCVPFCAASSAGAAGPAEAAPDAATGTAAFSTNFFFRFSGTGVCLQ